jgi:hypothetical protein
VLRFPRRCHPGGALSAHPVDELQIALTSVALA